MSHSYNKIWIHAIWSTKDRFPLIETKSENIIHESLRNQFLETGCPVKIINGMPDHVHSLFLLNPQKSVAEVIKQVKGSTSHYINQQDMISKKFSWQTGYAAYSVSESILENVYLYIKNQKEHHAKTTFMQEYDEFLKLYGFDKGE